jgi:putative ABC transport system ATP-binding protein
MQIMHRRNHYHSNYPAVSSNVAVARAVIINQNLYLRMSLLVILITQRSEVMQMLTDLNEQGTTIIMVTSEHDARYSHRIIRILDGQAVTENILV